MCPSCQAPFVAPPESSVAKVASNRKLISILVGSAIGLCAVVGTALLVWPVSSSAPKSAVSVAAQSVASGGVIGAVGVDTNVPVATVAAAQPDQGIFKVAPQADKPPVVAIRNDSHEEFRLKLQDKSGSTRTELIPAESKKEFTVAAGYYSAVIDSPTNPRVVASNGQLQVQEFHHYQANFYIGTAAQHKDFFIGD